MPNCKARLTSESLSKGKAYFYNSDGSQSNYAYYLPLLCKKDSLTNSNLCGSCTDKQHKLDKCTISKNNRLNGASHPQIIHGIIGEPIPLWSHIEGGEWFKKMIHKGYKKEVEMVKQIDKTKVNEVISNLKGTKNKMVDALIEKFPELTKHAASKCITEYNKNKKEVNNTSNPSSNPIDNIIDLLKTKLIIDPTKKEEVYDIVDLIVKPIKISGIDYYYEPNKSKVYTLDYKYVGRYDTKEEKLFTNYADSDAEPDI